MRKLASLLAAALVCAACSNLGSKVVGTWMYQMDTSMLKVEDAQGLEPLRLELTKSRLELRADGTATVVGPKTKAIGHWSMEGSHLYVKPDGEGRSLEGEVVNDGTRINVDSAGTVADGTGAQLYLSKLPSP